MKKIKSNFTYKITKRKLDNSLKLHSSQPNGVGLIIHQNGCNGVDGGGTSIVTTTTTDTYEEYTCSSGHMDSSAPHSASGGGVNGSSGSGSNHILVQQVLELRRRLDEDHQGYKRKLSHYQESQQKQAQLVTKLQQKILQYKSKCNELEHTIESKNIEIERIRVYI